MQILLLLFSHPELSLSLSLQPPFHLGSSALYYLSTCRGFPCFSQLQLQFPFISFFLLLFACQHSPWFSELALCMPPLRMPHHATLCSSCLNCQSNFRLKILPPSRVIRDTQLEKSYRLVKADEGLLQNPRFSNVKLRWFFIISIWMLATPIAL